MSRRRYGWLFFLLISIASLPAASGPVLSNQVINHTSPYLAMHGEDPVRWQLWNKASLDTAQKLNRPILISIGYFSCHWCHVMQRESYRDPDVATLLNNAFVPVKVDRELDPVLDAQLIEFVELTRGQAGWPLNVLLTPDGYPLLGFTYLPRDAFYRLLTRFNHRWRIEEEQLRVAAADAVQEWQALSQAESEQKPPVDSPLDGFLDQVRQLKDELSGGFGQQNKFPMVTQLATLMKVAVPDNRDGIADFTRLTLNQMADQGMHDNLGGGFFRYVIDPGWQVPHYEKMLYDNAQLASLYFLAADIHQSQEYLAVARSTIDFMLREMRQGPAFISSFSAVDSGGREGFYYQWTDQQLGDALAGMPLEAALAAWFGEQAPESEYGRLPRWQADRDSIAEKLGWSRDRLDATLATAGARLLEERSKRELPADTKVLAAWNGLALTALADAYSATGDDDYRQAASALAAYLETVFWDGRELRRFVQPEGMGVPASLEDYALVAKGLWDWSRQQAPGYERYAGLSARLVRIAWDRYFRAGQWQPDDKPLLPVPGGKVAIPDGALPSSTALISRLSRDHPALRNDAVIHRKLEQHLRAVSSNLSDDMFWHASYLELLAEPQR